MQYDYTEFFKSLANFQVPHDVIGGGWLLNPVKLEWSKLFHPFNRLNHDGKISEIG